MKTAIKFLIGTFVITYIAHGTLIIVLNQGMIAFESFMGMTLFIVGGSAPTIVALYIVFRVYSHREKKVFFTKLFNFKHPPFFWMFVFLVPLGIGLFVNLIVYGNLEHISIERGDAMMLPIFLLNGIIFGGLEEVGWRGVLLDKLKRKSSVIVITIIIGLLWGVWHLPMFFIDDLSHADFALLPYLIGAIMYSGFITYIVLSTRSIALAIIMHAMINVAAILGMGIPFEHNFFVYLSLMFLIMIAFYLIYPIRRIAHEKSHH